MRWLVHVSVALWCLVASSSANVFEVYPSEGITIQQALDAAAASGDTVLLHDGTFALSSHSTWPYGIRYGGKAVVVRSLSGQAGACVIDGEGIYRGFLFNSGEGPGAVLSDVSITNCHVDAATAWYYPSGGAGIRCSGGASPTITGCILAGNSIQSYYDPYFDLTARGAGILCVGASPTVTGCVFVGNWGEEEYGSSGAGMACVEGASPAVTGCTFEGNWAPGSVAVSCSESSPTITFCEFIDNRGNVAGGIGCSESSPTISDCVFLNNSAEHQYGRGGAIYCTGAASSPSITRCLFSGNSAGLYEYHDAYGGALCCWSSASPVLVDCVFLENRAYPSGGAVYCILSSSPSFTNCTFYANWAFGAGSSIISRNDSAPTLENSIIALGTGGGSVGCAYDGTITLTCCDVYGNAGGDWLGCIAGQNGINGNISEDALFCGDSWSPEDPFTLCADSPCAPDQNVECGLIGARPVGCGPSTGIAESEVVPAATASLGPNVPNPFAPSTRIAYTMSGSDGASAVVLRIYDVGGRSVRTLVDSRQPPGTYTVTWDGRDDGGCAAGSGIYFCRLLVGGRSDGRRMVLVR